MPGLTRETLRHYRNIGLVQPARVLNSGYNLFDDRSALDLMLIRYYRSFDIPVSRVQHFIHDADMKAQYDVLNDALASIDQQILQLERIRDALLRRMRIVGESQNEAPLIQYDPIGKMMYLLNVQDAAAQKDKDDFATIRAMAALFPHAHISLAAGLDDFLA